MAESKKQPRQNCIIFLCLSIICLCLAALSLCCYNMILQRQLSHTLRKLQSRMEIVENNFAGKDGEKGERFGQNAANRKANEGFFKEIERRLHAYETACRVATNKLRKRVSVLEANLDSATNLHQVFVNDSVNVQTRNKRSIGKGEELRNSPWKIYFSAPLSITTNKTLGTIMTLRGPPGERGKRGKRGKRGEKGMSGGKGQAGPAGPRGLKGNIGVTGPKGDLGPIGQKGERGQKGDNGNQGSACVKGEKGDSGVIGPKGDLGPIGQKGERGQKGDNGNQGSSCVKGEKGDKGLTGQKGDAGTVGQKGEAGNLGSTGAKGEKGAIGPKGDTGAFRGVFKDCEEAKAAGMYYSGRVKLILPNKSKIGVYCDMVTDGGGWIIFQKRADSTVSFERDWKAYEQGFGDVNGNHWMGLSSLHSLTSTGSWTLRVDLKLSNGEKGFVKYANFKIGSNNTKYKLIFDRYSAGNIGDALWVSRGMPFSTADSDNDNWAANNCALHYKGAWWHNQCFHALLNTWHHGTKKPGSSLKPRMTWYGWKKTYEDITFSEMKIKIGG